MEIALRRLLDHRAALETDIGHAGAVVALGLLPATAHTVGLHDIGCDELHVRRRLPQQRGTAIPTGKGVGIRAVLVAGVANAAIERAAHLHRPAVGAQFIKVHIVGDARIILP